MLCTLGGWYGDGEKSITVTDQQDSWIKAQIDMGHYGNESEVVCELIRERQMRELESSREVEIIRAKLIQAEANGFTDQSLAEILQEIRNGLGRDAI